MTATSPRPLDQIRLAQLAKSGAGRLHGWYFDPTENLDEEPPNGHVEPFETCPHPDCILVHAALASAPSSGAPPAPSEWPHQLPRAARSAIMRASAMVPFCQCGRPMWHHCDAAQVQDGCHEYVPLAASCAAPAARKEP